MWPSKRKNQKWLGFSMLKKPLTHPFLHLSCGYTTPKEKECCHSASVSRLLQLIARELYTLLDLYLRTIFVLILPFCAFPPPHRQLPIHFLCREDTSPRSWAKPSFEEDDSWPTEKDHGKAGLSFNSFPLLLPITAGSRLWVINVVVKMTVSMVLGVAHWGNIYSVVMEHVLWSQIWVQIPAPQFTS